MYFVYILKCADGTSYTGYTHNLEERRERHLKGYVEYTSHRLPTRMVFSAAFLQQSKALDFEKYLK